MRIKGAADSREGERNLAERASQKYTNYLLLEPRSLLARRAALASKKHFCPDYRILGFELDIRAASLDAHFIIAQRSRSASSNGSFAQTGAINILPFYPR